MSNRLQSRWQRGRLNPASTLGGDALVPLLCVLLLFAVVRGRISLESLTLLAILALAFVFMLSVSNNGVWGIAIASPLLFPLSAVASLPIPIAPGIVIGAAAAVIALSRPRDPSPNTKLPPPRRSIAFASGLFAVAIVANSLPDRVSIEAIPWLLGPFWLLIIATRQNSLPSLTLYRHSLVIAVLLSGLNDSQLALRGLALNADSFNSGRFQGQLGDYELTAEYYAVGCLLAVTGLLMERTTRWTLLYVATLVQGGILVILTETRSAAILVMVGVAALVLGAFIARGTVDRRTVFVVASAAIAGLWIFRNQILGTSLAGRLGQIQTTGPLDDILNRSRAWNYFRGLESFRDAGFLGNGFPYPYDSIGTFPHSLYLWTYWTLGVFGLAALLGLLAVLLIACAARARRRDIHGIAGLVIVCVLALDQYKIEVARLPEMVVFFWLILGYTTVASREVDSLR